MRVGATQHYHFRVVIRGFLMGRAAKIKWLLLQHLIRKRALSLSCSCFWNGESRGKGLTSLSCSSALGSMDGQGNISLPVATALPKPLIISWDCKEQSCTKLSSCGCNSSFRGRRVFKVLLLSCHS